MPHSPAAHRVAHFRGPELILSMGILLLSSCAAAPFLIPAGIEFARNLLVTSNKNYGGKYSDDMNRLMMRLSTPYVAMGLPMGTPSTALVPPTMLQQQQQQAMMNQQMMMGQNVGQQPGQFGQPMGGQFGAGMPGQVPMDPYATGQVGSMGGMVGGMQGGMPGQQMFGQQQGFGYGAMQGGMYGQQQQGYYDPNNPYLQPGMNVQAQPYGMQQFGNPYGAQYGQVGAQPYGQMGGYQQQPGFSPQGAPLQPGYPAAAPGSQAPMPTPGYPPQTMPGYPGGMQNMPMQQAQVYQQPGMDPYQQQQQQMMQGGQVYQQPVMQGYPQPGMPGMQSFPQQQMGGYQQPVGAPPYGAPNMGVGYPGQIYPRSIAGPTEPVALDVALLRQVTTPTGKQVVMLQDGETLKGGPGGDRFKLVVRTNCECFVYVISIDGSGWAQAVFPVANGSVSNPLKPETEQAFPEGPYWFNLDEHKGVESFFLVASPARRVDLEESLTQLAGQQRPAGQAAAKVEEPAVIPNGFGKTQAAKATLVKDESQQPVQITPLSYVAAKPGEDVRITRWFNHQ